MYPCRDHRPVRPRHRPLRQIAMLAALVLSSSAARADSKPSWGVKPDPVAPPYSVPIKPSMAVPLPNPTGIWPLYSTTPSPFVVVGQNGAEGESREVWDLRTLQKTGSIRGKLGSSTTGPARLSPDGRFLAVDGTGSGSERVVEVWSFGDGKLARRIEPRPVPKKVLGFDFAAEGKVVLAIEAEIGNLLQVYDFQTGSLAATHPLGPKFQANSLAFSPGRKLAAYLTDVELRVVDLANAKLVGSLPAKGACKGMAFSPDGTELAASFFEAPGGRLTSWDLVMGEMAVTHVLPSGPTFETPGWAGSAAPAVEWLPDGSAWLLDGHALVNRQDGRWVWSVFAPSYQAPNGSFRPNALIYSQAVKILDDDHAIAGLKGADGPRLEVVKLPWAVADASLKAFESGAPALLGAGGSLTLTVNVGGVRHSTPAEAEAGLTEAIREGLAAQGIGLASGRQVVLHVKHSEEPGPAYRIFGPGGNNGSVTSTRFVTELTLTVSGSKTPAWSERKDVTGLRSYASSRETGGKTDEAGLRMGGFEGLKETLSHLGMPYFIPRPQDKDLAMLPGTTILAASARLGGTNAVNPKAARPTKRGQVPATGRKP